MRVEQRVGSRAREGVAAPREPVAVLSRREALLRSATIAALAGIALVHAIGVPVALDKGWQFGALSFATVVLSVGLGLGLALASEKANAQVWRLVAGGAILVLASWAALRAFAVPGWVGMKGHWTTRGGLVSATLAVACLVLAILATPPSRAGLRSLAVAAAVLVAIGPGIGALLVSVGPGLPGGETTLAASAGHVHGQSTTPTIDAVMVFRPGPNGGSYVYLQPAPRRATPLGIGMWVAATLLFAYGAIGYVRRRTVPREPSVPAGIQGGLA